MVRYLIIDTDRISDSWGLWILKCFFHIAINYQIVICYQLPNWSKHICLKGNGNIGSCIVYKILSMLFLCCQVAVKYNLSVWFCLFQNCSKIETLCYSNQRINWRQNTIKKAWTLLFHRKYALFTFCTLHMGWNGSGNFKRYAQMITKTRKTAHQSLLFCARKQMKMK